MWTNFNARIKSNRAVHGLVLATAVMCVAPRLALAQTEAKDRSVTGSDAERAAMLFQQAKADADAEKLDDALRGFGEAWQLSKTSEVAANLAIVEVAFGHHRDAAEHFRFALSNLSPSATDQQKQAIVTGLDAAKSHVLTLVVQGAPAGASISIDGVVVGLAPLIDDVYVEPRAHHIRADAAGFQSMSQPIEGPAGAALAVQMALERIAETHRPDRPVSLPLPLQTSGVEPRTVVLWSGVGVTAASLGLAIGFAVKGASRDKDAKNVAAKIGAGRCGSATDSSLCAQLVSLLDDRNSANKIANFSFVAAGAAAVATTATFILWPGRKTEKTAAFRVMPVATYNSAGLAVDGVF